MEIKEIFNKIQWENFVLSRRPNTFLQSWNWGEFNRISGEKIWRFGFYENSKLIGVAMLVKVEAKRGKFLFCPHFLANGEILVEFFNFLKILAKNEKADFIRISPLMENTSENFRVFRNYGFRSAPVHMMHPELSWMLDIAKSEEEILKGMRKTTRNLIRRAERPFDCARGRENIEISEVKNIEGIEEFYKLHEQTVGRHGFVPFSKDYLKKEFEVFLPDNQISIFFAKHGGQILSSAIIVFYGQAVFYHHGASLASKAPASYLLMWKIIKSAKNRGCRIFNFWGIAPEGKPRHPWAGLTLFKKGFGGYKEEYLHAQDLVLSSKYWFNYIIEKMRRIKRGY